MRGKHSPEVKAEVSKRITPADAGKTTAIRLVRGGDKDHPRGCGENGYLTTLAAWMMGSPPRMRGKLGGGGCAVVCIGITPADAGKTVG